jgi:hypothetical protein
VLSLPSGLRPSLRLNSAKNLYMHGPEHVDLQVPVYPVEDYDGLIDRLKSGEADLAKSGIRHLKVDPVKGPHTHRSPPSRITAKTCTQAAGPTGPDG